MLIQANALQLPIASETVQCVVTSPPYWGLRDYGTARWEGGEKGCEHKPQVQARIKRPRNGLTGGLEYMTAQEPNYKDTCPCGARRIDSQLGLERTPEEFVANMVAVFREVWRVLRKDGTCWVNLGDAYAHTGASGGTWNGSSPEGKNNNTANAREAQKKMGGTMGPGLKPKDLVGIPWRLAFALQQPWYSGSIKRLEDRIWLGAMIDGEGCMFIHKRKAGQSNGQGYERQNDSYGAGLEVANTHESIVKRCLEITGMGSICFQDKESKLKNRNQRLFRWNLRSNECRKVVREIYPFLVGKQHEARLLLGCPSSGMDAEKAHASLINLHNGFEACIDFPAPTSCFERGWYLRSDIIWSKLNPMPESVTDRPTKAHEYLFLLSKRERYYYDQDAIRESYAEATLVDPRDNENGHRRERGFPGNASNGGTNLGGLRASGRNKRTVWTIPTQPWSGAHFATFPEKLVEPCILAGSRPGDYVLDPFVGSGTVIRVATRHQRKGVGCDINLKYLGEQASKRTRNVQVQMAY